MNGFILVFGMALVLAVERRLAADRAAVGGPARSRQSRPWPGARPQPYGRAADARPVAGCPPAADGPACGQVPVRSRQPPPPVGGCSPVAGCPGARR